MIVKQLADQLNLWQHIERGVAGMLTGRTASTFLERIANIPIHKSRATRRLGVYVSMGRNPVCIRLQFAQEPDTLRQTFLHEVAHACDHLSRKGLRKSYRQAHGEDWKIWALALGVSTSTSGESAAVRQLHQRRLKLVGICQKCGAEFHRVRRLNKNRSYTHNQCGGEIQPH
ncbi:MAG: SprT-like domain-containing protein [Desulfuromusa sp.]